MKGRQFYEEKRFTIMQSGVT